MFVFYLLICLGCTFIITRSSLFEPLREKVDNGGDSVLNNFWGLFIVCPACVGFWFGIFWSFYFNFLDNYIYISYESENWILWALIILLSVVTLILKKVAYGAISSIVCYTVISILDYVSEQQDKVEVEIAKIEGESFIIANQIEDIEQKKQPMND